MQHAQRRAYLLGSAPQRRRQLCRQQRFHDAVPVPGRSSRFTPGPAEGVAGRYNIAFDPPFSVGTTLGSGLDLILLDAVAGIETT